VLRRKLPALQAALDGRVTPHHRFLLGELLDHLEFVEGKILRSWATIEEGLRAFEDTVRRLCTILGVDRVSAWRIISEIGLTMDQFPDARHLASWAGLWPGNWERSGKRTSVGSGKAVRGPGVTSTSARGPSRRSVTVSLRALSSTGGAWWCEPRLT
jgi:transposase